MMLMSLFFTALLIIVLHGVVKFVSGVYPVYGTLSTLTFYGVTALYLWHLLVRGRR
jgi:hypothetical protein